MSTTTTINAGESAKTITLPEGKAVILTGSAGASGVAYLLDQALGGTNSLRSWAVGFGALAAIGPYENTQKIHLTCSVGSIAATVKEAVLTISASTTPTPTPTPTPTAPGQPAKPVLTAMAGAVSLAWTPGAAGSTATTGNAWTDINGNVTQLTTNPQVISGLTPGTPYTGTVTTRNAQGAGPASAQADAVTPIAAPSAVPFDSATAFSSGQQVLYAGGVYSFTAAHAAGDWTGRDVAYVGQVSGQALNKVGVNKPFGVVSDFQAGGIVTAATSTPATSRGMKLQVEGPFDGVKVQQFNREPWPTRGFSMSVAATEQPAIGSVANAISPIVGGTPYNVLRANSPNGFDVLKFNGSTRSPVQPPGGVSSPGQGYVTNISVVTSEWSNTNSVPALTPGNREMVVALFNRIANVGDASSSIRAASMSGTYNMYAAGDPRGRLMVCPSAGAGDHVADPTLSRAAGALYDPSTGGVWQNIAFILRHLTPVRNIYGFGDSITEGYAWWQDVIRTLSTREAPMYVTNFGCSTNRSSQYLALHDTIMSQENYATDLLLPTFSPNEVQDMTDALADGFIAELKKRVDFNIARGRRVYVWTTYAQYTTRYSGVPSRVAAIQKINDYWRAEALKPGAGFKLVEIADGWDNDTMIIKGTDNTHPNPTVGQPYMSSKFRPVIQLGA